MANIQVARKFFLAVLPLVLAHVGMSAAFAGEPTFHVLTVFEGVSNGSRPWATPIVDSAGNLYGTTVEGGDGPCSYRQFTFGCGTVYKLSPPASGTQWTETLLYQFQNDADGAYPYGTLVFDSAGNLYGTTEFGGTTDSGTVFELTPPALGNGPWTKTTIYNFGGVTFAALPVSGLTLDKAGNLYGTAPGAGPGGAGVVFELTPPSSGGGPWSETDIYSFAGYPDGGVPESTLVLSDGILYGTTNIGGANDDGTVFELSPPDSPGGTWTETILHSFGASGDGSGPRSGMVLGENGVFYGVTQFGGSMGIGAVYQLSPPSKPGGNWTETVLYDFPGDVDGVDPISTPVIGPDGSLYGTTLGGGDEYGNVFKLTPPSSTGNPWTGTEILDFRDYGNDAIPIAGLVFGKDDWLYGAAYGAGEDFCLPNPSRPSPACGELFSVLP